jgi:nucleotide-binding universal stress UspA family protein
VPTLLVCLCQAELHLLGIVSTTGSSLIVEAEGQIDVWGLQRQDIERALESAAHDLGGKGVKAVTSIRQGDPASEIVAHAHEIKADLVVLGHSEKGMIIRWFEGSVGAELLNSLPCSLLIATGAA